MARVTVEDCIDKVPSRYELVMVAAQRARDISAGAHLCVDRDNDKNSVVALREIAENKVTLKTSKDAASFADESALNDILEQEAIAEKEGMTDEDA